MIERMIMQLASMMKVENDVSTFQNIRIKGVSIDTRKISPGNLFIPFKGEQTDGHQYVETAIQNGAAAVLWQKDVPNPPEDMPVLIVEDTLLALQELAQSYRNDLTAKIIAITGSNGKTTTKDIGAAVFSETFKVHKTEGNFNNHIGLPLTVLTMDEATEIGILEMGMSGKGEIALLTKLARPDVAIITNIGEAHMQDLGSREAIANAKLEIVEGLPKGGLLIYPGNEPLLVKRVSGIKQIRTCTFGATCENDLYPEDIEMNEFGSRFLVRGMAEEPLNLPIPGKHNIFNSLAIMLAAKEFSMEEDAVRRGLEAVKLSNMRMEWRDGLNGTRILNDAYNSSPTATRAVISMVEHMDAGREKILVLGDMLELGENEIVYHEQVGEEINPDKIKYVFTYGKLGKYIGEGAKKHFSESRIFHFTDKEKLADAIKEKSNGSEIILVKASRGMRLEETVDALTVSEQIQ
ncbi:UDP-N-acetylmuramoyl-tripeptide--D-alanyl-D-alanine ligase [Lederbergia lenta]|uniref:UDP-N-acetylmuramoyl-tripeptide--D-alanyl-D-alanine ligase n=1 Tax=Lederbergia lenta TaxID=1467 RepID=A0A2X4VQJ9_LEDLE|nr:UDP-N-acetylmuramoyl-tripeptide--D-alanyl-D-alanine ligase [Lederbergia lenta]MCM3112292.1 UDP-N-acetylmuramoyl-tripeptide--D-alanyl-D-alanine ligase [Lederbergia lenta]MEC2326512.1 UDP-N-acetylmuramoyl-tripeptide--D-alanyl-D-alanine ligase [Lederbergia lenta]SQI53243.1 UDP-N-acetylmuramoylalanyl-D-glutamyl-2, 6-diaminopimelate/D-alanyl-D-alanyl ligase [Lederbergia lenta]